jgi:hypothetical protein
MFALHRRATLVHGNCATTLFGVFEFGIAELLAQLSD